MLTKTSSHRLRWKTLVGLVGFAIPSLAALVLWGHPANGATLSPDAACKKLFQQKEYAQAGSCFERFLPKAWPASMTEHQKLPLGRRIRNAVTSYRLAAKATNVANAATYLKERATLLLQRYLKRQLYENTFRKNSAMVLLYKLRKQIGYAQVTILTNGPKDRIELFGYHYRKSFRGTRWTGLLRPGTYRLIAYPATKERPFSTSFQVKPGEPTFFQLPAPLVRRPQPRPKASKKPPKVASASTPLPRTTRPNASRHLRGWATGLLIIAGVAGITSLSLFAASKQIQSERDQTYQKTRPAAGQQLPEGDITVTRELHGAQLLGSQLATSSAAIAAICGASLLGGGISLTLFLTQQKPSTQQLPPTAPPKAQARGIHGIPTP